MSKKPKKFTPKEKHEDLPLDDESLDENTIDSEDEESVLEEEYEPEIDPDEDENDDEYFISKAKTSPCLKNNFCKRCDGSPHEPEGLCYCPCHDIA